MWSSITGGLLTLGDESTLPHRLQGGLWTGLASLGWDQCTWLFFCCWVGLVPYLELFWAGPVKKDTLYKKFGPLKIFFLQNPLFRLLNIKVRVKWNFDKKSLGKALLDPRYPHIMESVQDALPQNIYQSANHIHHHQLIFKLNFFGAEVWFLDAIASPSTYPCRSVSQLIFSEWR